MPRTAQQLCDDAQQIWWAGVCAVKPARLVPEFVTVDGQTLLIGGLEAGLGAIDLGAIDRIAIVGAGKAGAGMTLALEAALGDKLLDEKQVGGWVNVPADCVEPTRCVRLHAARPAGVNEPTAEGVVGSAEILRLVGQLGPRDLCLCVISGGGSALLPAPVEGLSLGAKVALTREISARGGTIEQMNAVRRELSTIKGGGLARACGAGRLVSLILSDVLGDDLEVIASGPTVVRQATPELALQVLEELQLGDHPAGREAIALLELRNRQVMKHEVPACEVHNLLIGNNATAVDAAGIEAERLGYSHAMISATASEGTAESVAAHLVEMAKSMRDRNVSGGEGPDCLISGGEPIVQLSDESTRGKGGRNQQLVLAALASLKDWQGLALLAGGTDGEDGPTDAAGALVDEQIAALAKEKQLDLADYLKRNDAYHCFQQLDGLLKTGPTHTNVCDLRVITVNKAEG